MHPLLLALSFICGLAAQTQPQSQPASIAASEASTQEEVAVITTDVGQIVVRFFPELAPNHVDNFKQLARDRFYDGTSFHRVVPGFVIQGGDPNTKDDNPNNDGMGDGPRMLKAEFSDRPHVRGILSMARSSDPNSASCQFFIVHQAAPHLDGKYSVFGHVIEGMDVVDKIGTQATGVQGRLRDVPNKTITITRTVVESP